MAILVSIFNIVYSYFISSALNAWMHYVFKLTIIIASNCIYIHESKWKLFEGETFSKWKKRSRISDRTREIHIKIIRLLSIALLQSIINNSANADAQISNQKIRIHLSFLSLHVIGEIGNKNSWWIMIIYLLFFLLVSQE